MSTPDPGLPSPADPAPRWHPLVVRVAGAGVTVQDDRYSDRIRCDHPDPALPGSALGEALLDAARERGRGRLVVLAPERLREGLEAAGLATEAVMPSFYAGQEACAVLGRALRPAREGSADAEAARRVRRLCDAPPPGRRHARVPTVRAVPADAPALAALIAGTFAHYPTPSGVPEYLAEQISAGVPFRFARDGGEIVACASADLVRAARTAELTDCATRPNQRGRGLMQWILTDLMDDLRALGYPTAFTLARARVPGVNLAFQRLGFHFRGLMRQSCRIGDGMEDMTVWSREL